MGLCTYKNNKKIIGSIIKINRINNNISQKELSKGICVPSYLSRIENGELLPSEDMISIIFNRLGLTFNDSDSFLEEGITNLNSFFQKLNFNEFDETSKSFDFLEQKENEYITSPLVLDYFAAKLARYSTTNCRDKFNSAQNMLLSSFDFLSTNQKFLYNYYVGVDTLLLSNNKNLGIKYFNDALSFKETGHCYFWLSHGYIIKNNPIKAYETIKKALDLYVIEGNKISIMSCYEKLAEVYCMLDIYNDALTYLNMSLNIAKKIDNPYFIEHLNSLLAWTYYRKKDFDSSLKYLNYNSGLIDHRKIIPDSIIKSLIYFTNEDKNNLKNTIFELKKPGTIEHIGEDLSNMIYKLFNYYLEDEKYIKNPIWEGLLIYIIDGLHNFAELKKVFTYLLKEYYIQNRRYKDALLL